MLKVENMVYMRLAASPLPASRTAFLATGGTKKAVLKTWDELLLIGLDGASV